MDARDLLDALLVSALDALAAGKMRLLVPAAQHPKGTKGASKAFPFYEAQRHQHIEMVFASETGVSIFLEGRWVRHAPGEIWVFLPGTMHSEKATQALARYDMMWVSLNERALGVHVTAHRSDRGYFVHPLRLGFHPSVQQELWAAACAASRMDTRSRLLLQALLLQALVQAQDELDKPQAPAVSYQRQMVDLVRGHIEAHFAEDLPLARLAAMVHYTPSHLNSLFKRFIGRSVHQCILDVRLKQAMRLLTTTNAPVKQIAFQAGFGDPLYFSRLFRKRFGTPPSGMRGVPDA